MIPMDEVKDINLSRFNELGVRKLIELTDGDEQLLKYLPKNYKKKRTIDRTWFIRTIESVHPGYLGQLQANVMKVRQQVNPQDEKANVILCNDEWMEKLKQTDFISSMYQLIFILTPILQRKMAGPSIF